MKKQYEKVVEIDTDMKKTLVVVDDAIDLKIIPTKTGYKIEILNNRVYEIDVQFTNEVCEFEQ